METEQIPQTGEFLTAAIAWAKKVGKIHLAYFRGNRLDIHTKSNVADVVTRADRESEAYLLEKIAERFPTHSVLGEESGMHEKNTDFCWVVDPLDGTNNYSQGPACIYRFHWFAVPGAYAYRCCLCSLFRRALYGGTGEGGFFKRKASSSIC